MFSSSGTKGGETLAHLALIEKLFLNYGQTATAQISHYVCLRTSSVSKVGICIYRPYINIYMNKRP
jgi:hypothetical protein